MNEKEKNRVTATITRPEPVPQPEATVTLSLGMPHAEYLKGLLGRVHTNSPLGQLSFEIYEALLDVKSAPVTLRTLTNAGGTVIGGVNALSTEQERVSW